MISPIQSQSDFTLPPIQSLQSQSSYSQSQLNAYEPPQYRPATAESNNALSRVHTTTSNQESRRDSTSIHDRPHSPPAESIINASRAPAKTEESSSPIPAIKQEAIATPGGSSPIDARRPSDVETQSLKAIVSLKNEHGLRTQSPLRESSVPFPSTESAAPEPSVTKKRPAPAKTKKGTATTKKGPPVKKRKVEVKRSITPSSRASKPGNFRAVSSNGTPAESSPAPSNSQSDGVYDDASDDDEDMADGDGDGDVYCICRKPDTGTFMIGCDGTCDDWFHGKCVGIEERDKNLIDKYVCPACTKIGAGKTTWKRICRRHGCRQAARVGKIKGGKDGSKYCSEECGVLYFREMLAKTRGREDPKHRNSRRKNHNQATDQPSIDYDLGARGGTLAAGELKSLINSSATADDFKKLGEGVLSPPATPDSKTLKENEFNDSEAQALQRIHDQKEASRRKHQLLKDRMKLVTMVKQAASRTATEKDLKPKDYCGYDSRLEWTDAQFARWRASRSGQQAFELETLATDTVEDSDTITVEAAFEVCDRKKCARHLEWTKLAVDDLRFAMSDNSDRMRALEKEEKETKERAALRAKAGSLNGEGKVEVHGLGINVDGDGDVVVETVEGVKGSESAVAAV